MLYKQGFDGNKSHEIDEVNISSSIPQLAEVILTLSGAAGPFSVQWKAHGDHFWSLFIISVMVAFVCQVDLISG